MRLSQEKSMTTITDKEVKLLCKLLLLVDEVVEDIESKMFPYYLRN